MSIEWVERDRRTPATRTKTQREADFNRLWDATHPVWRGQLEDGTKSLMGHAVYGGGLVTMFNIEDAELDERLAQLEKTDAR